MNDERFEAILRPYLTNLSDSAELEPGTPLRELGLNSMRAIDLLFDLEEQFDFQLPDAAMNDDTFATAGSLRTRVEQARTATAAG